MLKRTVSVKNHLNESSFEYHNVYILRNKIFYYYLGVNYVNNRGVDQNVYLLSVVSNTGP